MRPLNNAGQIDGNGGSISSGLLNKSLMFPTVVVVVIVLVVTVVVVVIMVVDFLGILLIHMALGHNSRIPHPIPYISSNISNNTIS